MAKLQAYFWSKRLSLQSRKRKRNPNISNTTAAAPPSLQHQDSWESVESLLPDRVQYQPLGVHLQETSARFHFPAGRAQHRTSSIHPVTVRIHPPSESMAAETLDQQQDECCHGALNIEAKRNSKRFSAIEPHTLDTNHRQSRRASLFAPFKRQSGASGAGSSPNGDTVHILPAAKSSHSRSRSEGGMLQPDRSSKRLSTFSVFTVSSSNNENTSRSKRQSMLNPLGPISEKIAEKKDRRKTMDQQLFAAAAEGDTASVGLLISAGTKPYKPDAGGIYPVHHAAAGGHIPTLKGLLEHGASVEVKNKAGRTPLHVAVLNNQVDMTQHLIRSGAKVEDKDKWGFTALHLAASTALPDSTSGLATTQPPNDLLNVHSPPSDKRTSWVRPPSMLNPQLFDFGFDAADVISTTPSPAEARQRRISRSASSPNIVPITSCLQALIRSGADMEAVNDKGETPLHLAVRAGLVENVRLLLDHGANLLALNDEGLTPMSVLMSGGLQGGEGEVSRLLLERGEGLDGFGSPPRGGSLTDVGEEKEEVVHAKL